MGRTKSKTCTISGNTYPANSKNFYHNSNSSDNLHPYHKGFDNFRRATSVEQGASVEQVRKLVNLINS